MKRFLSLALCCAMMVCSFSVALAEEEDDLFPRDASTVIEENGRLTGGVSGPIELWDDEWNSYFGETTICLAVDAPAPQDFTDEQRVIITAPAITFSDEKLGAAMQSTGQRTWQFDEYVKQHSPDWGTVTGKPLPATMDADEACENAKQVALDFLREAGVDGARILSALRPEDEADFWAQYVIPEQRDAERTRILREWHTSHRDYTWVNLQFTLRGLFSILDMIDEDGVSCSSVANLYIGDAGEMRDAIIVHAPQEVSAVPYTGELITWREALEQVAGRFGCYEVNNIHRVTDERGREACTWEWVVTAVEPGYLSTDGETYAPAWVITVQDRLVDTGEFFFAPHLYTIDARVDR